MPEVSLSELTNIKPEATVNPGVILDSRDAVHELNQSAQFNAEMTQKRYAQRLDMLKGLYQDLGAIQETPVMDQDRPDLNKGMANILNTIAKDPRAALSGTGFNEIQKELGSLRAKATASKQDNIYSNAHRSMLESDPELNTEENKAKLYQHDSTPVGNRQKFVFDTPVKFDPEAAMGKILQQKQVAEPWANTSFEGPNNEFIIKESGPKYNMAPALSLWDQGYETGADVNNQPIKKWAAQQFEKIKADPEQMQKFGNPKDPQEFYKNLGRIMWGAKGDIIGEKATSRTQNPYAFLSARQTASLYMEAVRENNREKLAGVKKTLETKGAPENANFIVRQYASALGSVIGGPQAIDIGKGKYVTEEAIDVPANILKTYAEAQKETIKEGHSTDPVTETLVEGNTPDLVTRTKDGNMRLVFHQRYAKTDKLPKGKSVGDFVTDSNGNKIVERQGVVPRRNLMSTLGKGIVRPQVLAYSIDEADKSLQGQPNSTIDKINAGEEAGTVIEQAHEAKKANQGKTYSFKGKNYTLSQIEKAAKASGLSVDAYIKQAGFK